jgi:phosphate transport system protein
MQREIEKLKQKILHESALVQEVIEQAVRALRERDEGLAGKVIEADYEIDQLEVEVEEDCLKILALYNPVAQDLRYVVAILKINNDLERMADQAVNIAERAKFLALRDPIEIPANLTQLADTVQVMLNHALRALINLDAKSARAVIGEDDQVDAIHRQMYDLIQEYIRRQPERSDCHINLISISRNLERIADQITNVAEDVIYLVEGQLVRHSQT